MKPMRNIIAGAVIAGSVLTGGVIGAATLGSAGAQTTTTTDASTSDAGNHGPHSANGITETPLTGTDLSSATAAAQKAVPGATVERAETDAEGAKYEVHMTKSDGSEVTVKLDASFNVTSTLNGRG